jgi:hypothetical protein
MNIYRVDETFKTPMIEGDIQNGSLKLKGKSLTEDARTFFSPFRDWLEGYFHSAAPELNIWIELEYYNTATSKFLVSVLLRLEKIMAKKPVKVFWRYDPDDIEMKETGLDFKNLIGEMIIMEAIEEE